MIVTIGERIKEERTKAEINQTELAAKCGVTRGYICNLESGQKADPSISTLVKIAEAIGIKISTLVRGL